MSLSYFLGANSHNGFSSLYDGFCCDAGDYLHIIKGGPGCGKSGLMRRIARSAEEMGYTVEHVLCSGDPDSLDGVYIRELRQGWLDGTAPHVRDVHRFGLDSDYVNLGAFCRTPLRETDQHYVNALYVRYQAAYAKAYQALQAAEAASSLLFSHPLPKNAYQTCRNSLWEIVSEHKKRVFENDPTNPSDPLTSTANPHVRRCFLRGITCRGIVFCGETVEALCKFKYALPLSPMDCDLLLTALSRTCERQGLPTLRCCDPGEPNRLEGLLLPSLSLGFCTASWPVTDALALPGSFWEEKQKRRQDRELSKAEAAFRKRALRYLSEAKALHDELESFSITAMDFTALNDFAKEHIAQLLS